MLGMTNILESCQHGNVEHLVRPSSSSVYGANTSLPFSEDDQANHPISLYAATKGANELMAQFYGHVFWLADQCAKVFTVYGPWGRPDIALFKFTKAILENKEIARTTLVTTSGISPMSTISLRELLGLNKNQRNPTTTENQIFKCPDQEAHLGEFSM